MNSNSAVAALAALAQDHRLALFRLLVQAGDAGQSAGDLAAALDIPPSSLSFHLAHLQRAGLIGATRQGRSIVYAACYPAMQRLIEYLTDNCCGGASCDGGETEGEAA